MTLSSLFVLLYQTVLRSLIVLAIGEIAQWTLRRSKAAAALRHLALLAALLASIALPLLSALLPPLPISIASVAPPRNIEPHNPVAATPQVAPSAPPVMAHPAKPAVVAISPTPEAANASATVAPRLTWPMSVALLYLAGIAAFLLRGGLSLLVLGLYSRRHCQKVSDTDLLALVARLAGTSQIAGRIRVLQPRAEVRDSAFAAPVIWGFWSPILLLPEQFTTWSDAQQRSVLLHEIAHIRRGDWAMQQIANLAQALYWFNPWVGAINRRMAAMAEQACDDYVLHAGVPAPDYGEHLLAVATAMRQALAAPRELPLWRFALSGSAPLSMARSVSHVETRLSAILAPQSSRRSLDRRAVFIVTSAALLLVAPVAAARLRTSTANVKRGTTDDGLQVTLTGIAATKTPTDNGDWWAPDGKPLTSMPDMANVPHTLYPFGHESHGWNWKEPTYIHRTLRFHIDSRSQYTEPVSTVGYVVAPLAITRDDQLEDGRIQPRTNDTQLGPDTPAIGNVCIPLPTQTRRITYRFGVATGPWQTITLMKPDHPAKGEIRVARPGESWGAFLTLNQQPGIAWTRQSSGIHLQTFPAPAQGGTEHRANLGFQGASSRYKEFPLASLNDEARRVIAWDAQGHAVPLNLTVSPETMYGNPSYIIPVTTFERIQTIELQVRPYRWFTFKDIPIQPGMPAPNRATDTLPNGAMRGIDEMHINRLVPAATTTDQTPPAK